MLGYQDIRKSRVNTHVNRLFFKCMGKNDGPSTLGMPWRSIFTGPICCWFGNNKLFNRVVWLAPRPKPTKRISCCLAIHLKPANVEPCRGKIPTSYNFQDSKSTQASPARKKRLHTAPLGAMRISNSVPPPGPPSQGTTSYFTNHIRVVSRMVIMW